MFDILVLSPVFVGAAMILILLLELGLGKVGFVSKGLGMSFNPVTKHYELSTGPVVGVIFIGAALVIAPLIIDYFLVSKKSFYVSGSVEIEGRENATGTRVISCYPLTMVERNGDFDDVRVFKDERGEFPRLAIELDGYHTEVVDLDEFAASKTGSRIELDDAVLLSIKQEPSEQ